MSQDKLTRFSGHPPKDQLKNKTKWDIANALEKDKWEKEFRRGAVQGYRQPGTGRKVTIHPHSDATIKSSRLRKAIFDATGWTENDLVRLKLIRRPKGRHKSTP